MKFYLDESFYFDEKTTLFYLEDKALELTKKELLFLKLSVEKKFDSNYVANINSKIKSEFSKLFLKKNGKLYSSLIPQFFKKFSITIPDNILVRVIQISLVHLQRALSMYFFFVLDSKKAIQIFINFFTIIPF